MHMFLYLAELGSLSLQVLHYLYGINSTGHTENVSDDVYFLMMMGWFANIWERTWE